MSEQQTSSPPKELTCEQVRELLSDYVDREISKEEKSSVEHHLNTCLKCANESHNIQGLKRVAQQWPGAQASGEFRKSVMQRMIRESQQMPAAGIRQAADAAAAQSARAIAPEDDDDTKNLPPIWILAAAITLAVGVYYLILWLRGVQ